MIGRSLGKKIEGNDSGIIKNLMGHLAISKARLRSGNTGFKRETYRFPDPEIKNKGIIDSSNLDKFRKNYLKHIESEKSVTNRSSNQIRTNALSSLDFNFLKHDMDYRKLFPEEVDRQLRKCYSSSYTVIGLKAFRSYHQDIGPNRKSNTRSWHIDAFNPSILKVFIPLNDVKQENGPTHYLSRKDTKKVIRKRDRASYALNPDIEGVNIKSFTCEKGSAYILNVCQRLHRAGIPDPGKHRDMLMFSVIPSKDSEPKFKLAKSKNELLRYRRGIKQLFR